MLGRSSWVGDYRPDCMDIQPAGRRRRPCKMRAPEISPPPEAPRPWTSSAFRISVAAGVLGGAGAAHLQSDRPLVLPLAGGRLPVRAAARGRRRHRAARRWIFFVRSTLAAMGALGVGLLLALFSAIVWWVVSLGWLDVGNRSAMAWVVLLILGLVLGDRDVLVAHPPASSPARPRSTASTGDRGIPGAAPVRGTSAHQLEQLRLLSRCTADSASARRSGSCASSPASGG
jgi:hypothetical protein